MIYKFQFLFSFTGFVSVTFARVQAPLLYKIHNQNLWLSSLRSIFWEEEKAVILSDLHFGKTGHFRKSGIPVPQNIFKEDLHRLVSLLQYFKPRKLIVVGDFFHSEANTELDWFKKWRAEFSYLDIFLVKGNHDILKEKWYSETGITVIQNELKINSFLFIHNRCVENEFIYTFCGHIHPGISLYGAGKQSLSFPCFYFTANYCILPAFSKFTGMAKIQPGENDHLFAVVENSLVAVQ